MGSVDSVDYNLEIYLDECDNKPHSLSFVSKTCGIDNELAIRVVMRGINNGFITDDGACLYSKATS